MGSVTLSKLNAKPYHLNYSTEHGASFPLFQRMPSKQPLLGEYDTSHGLCLILCYSEFTEFNKRSLANAQKKRRKENEAQLKRGEEIDLNKPVEYEFCSPLPGNKKDVARLKETFEKFKFKVDFLEDKSADETRTWLHKRTYFGHFPN